MSIDTIKKYKNKNWLKEQYKKKSISKLAEECAVDDKTIIYWLKKFKLSLGDMLLDSNMSFL